MKKLIRIVMKIYLPALHFGATIFAVESDFVFADDGEDYFEWTAVRVAIGICPVPSTSLTNALERRSGNRFGQ